MLLKINNKMLKFIILLNTFANCYMSIYYKSYQNTKKVSLFDNSYLDIISKNRIILADERLCEICKKKINVKKEIPYNCTIPLGCPFSKKNIRLTISNNIYVEIIAGILSTMAFIPQVYKISKTNQTEDLHFFYYGEYY